MLERLGRFTVRRRKVVLVASALFLVASGVFGGGVVDRLTSGGFEDPDSEAVEARELLENRFNAGDPNVVMLVTAKDGSVDDKAVAAAGLDLTGRLAQEKNVEQVVSYWSLGSPPPLASGDGTQALVLGRIDPPPSSDKQTEDFTDERAGEISEKYTQDGDVIAVGVGGWAEVFRQAGDTVEKDLQRAEIITLPVVLILLVLVFGSVVAASLPLAVGAIAVLGTFLVLQILTGATDVSVYAINMTTAMSLGLAIDYSLFIVSRYREEMRNGMEPHDAVVESVRTAGRTVVFSGLTVGVSLAALMVFPLIFLRSFAYAGIAVVTIAVAGAVVTLPAMLAVLGRRVDALSFHRRRTEGEGSGFWHRLATAVMRRPIVVSVIVVGFLLVLGLPFFGINFGIPDDRVLPEEATSRQVQDDIRDNFDSQEAGAVSVVAADAGSATAIKKDISSYASELSSIEGVSRVDALTGSFQQGLKVIGPSEASARFEGPDGTWFSVVPSVEPISAEGETLVKEIRAAPAPFDVAVSGRSAQLVDSKEAIFSKIPLAAGMIAVVTFVVLFLMFGSILVPIKALVLNMLSLSATFGAIVWVFQEGNLSGFLDFTPTNFIEVATPILMFCIAFGLSMDYEVFLLSRIKEEYDRTGDNAHSVATGLEKTGRIVTAAAALLAAVFIAFATSDIMFIKLFGIGLSLAILMDATLIRALLVPAFMKLAGRANWWAPPVLRRWHERFGISSEAPAGPRSPAPARHVETTP
jgi:putative drug exporter of the RND superfamily